MRPAILLVTLTCLRTTLWAGTAGIIEGFVTDARTGSGLPGVNVVVVDMDRGTTTDGDGHYQIQNLRAGTYRIRFSTIGYTPHLLTNVIVNADLRTRLNVKLEPADINLDEVVVIQEKPIIQKDVTGSTFIVSGHDIEALPVDAVADVLRLQPGVTVEGNVRGGKSTEVLYLIDGLPVQDVLEGGVAATLPTSSVFGASFYVGGLDAEYGNALSGVVNIVTRTGAKEHSINVRADKDNLFGGTQNSRTTEFELSAHGPLIENKLFYLGAFNGMLTDTRYWQDLDLFFPSPIDKRFSGFGKLDYQFSKTLRLGVQGLFDFHNWHDYQFSWRYNLNGLPPEKRHAYRLAAILSHTLSETFFYTASFSRFSLLTAIGAGSKDQIPVNDPYQYDFFLRYVIDGQQAWWTDNLQVAYNAKVDGTLKAGEQHLLKMGAEINLYDLQTDIVKYEPQKTFFGKPLVNEPQLNFSTAYRFHPKSGSLYVQDKIDLPKDGLLLNLGLRYDFLDPSATRPAIEHIPVSDSSFSSVTLPEIHARPKHQLSPRLGVAMQLTERSYFFVNLGWYFQYPLFQYLYSGIDRVGLARGISALTGNPDLEPERVLAYELTVKYNIVDDLVLSLGYFRKEATNQIDSKTFISGNSRIAGSYGYAEYVNNPNTEARGFEVVISRERTSWLQGEISYTFMKTEGTSGSASDGFFIAQYGLPPARRVYPLSWDQPHTLKATLSTTMPWGFTLTTYIDYHTGHPYTHYPTATGFEQVDSTGFRLNNARMPDYFSIDLKARYTIPLGIPQSALSFYLEVRNLLNAKNVQWIDSNGRIGGELYDPGGYYIGRRTTLGVQYEL